MVNATLRPLDPLERYLLLIAQQAGSAPRPVETVRNISPTPAFDPRTLQLVASVKSKQLDHWQYQYLDIVLETLTGTKKNCKN